jgi:hypothetical protein
VEKENSGVPEQWLRPRSVKETSKIVNKNEKTVYAAVKDGQIPSIKIGKSIMIPGPWLYRTLSEGN